MICLRLIIAAVRALTAMSLATLTWRIISTAPSADLGIAGLAGKDGASGVLGIDRVGLAPQAPVAAVGAHDLDGADVASAHGAGQPGTVGAGSLDAEGDLAAEAQRPVDQLDVAAGVGRE